MDVNTINLHPGESFSFFITDDNKEKVLGNQKNNDDKIKEGSSIKDPSSVKSSVTKATFNTI